MSTTQPRAWGAFSGQPYGSFASKTTTAAAVPVRGLPGWHYTPGLIPMDAPAWIVQELQSVSRSTYGAAPFLQLQVQSREPTKLNDGMVALADGTDWDPGSGAGVYARIGGAWVKLG